VKCAELERSAELSAKDAEVRTLKDTHAQELKQQREDARKPHTTEDDGGEE